jgi:hypothetical protein
MKVLLLGALVAWASAAPVVWIVRDGLGPGMVESEWPRSVFKFLVIWGVPAIVLVVPLIVLWILDRRAVQANHSSQ